MKNIEVPSEKNFGIIFSVIFMVLYLFIFENFYLKNFLLIFSILFLLSAFFKPSFLRVPNKLWFKFGILLGNIISPIVMGAIFIFVFFPISILVKIFKKDFMDIKINNKVNSYWKTKVEVKQSMKNQF